MTTMKTTAYTSEGARREGEVELPADVFDGTVSEAALHQAVVAARANARQGTHATKTRQTVAGGGRKPWRQKGTGRARAGSIRSPLWRGGAVIFGPQPRSHRQRLPRKVKALAIRSALNARALEGDLVVVEPLTLERPRTRAVAGLLAGIGAEGRKVLLLTDGLKPEVHLSARNIPGVVVRPWGEASAYDILWSDVVLVEEPALSRPADAAGRSTAGGDGEEEA